MILVRGSPVSQAAAVAISLVFMLWASSASAVPKAGPVVTAVVDGFIRPAYQSFDEAVAASVKKLRMLCEAPSDTHLAAARDAFSAIVKAWGRAEIVRFG